MTFHMRFSTRRCFLLYFRYDEIISRYINVIVGWFNGHTHKDELRVVYDPTINGGTPVLTGFVAPSVTTYSDINMAYRVYYVDSKRENATFRVADYDTFYLNVSQGELETSKNSSSLTCGFQGETPKIIGCGNN